MAENICENGRQILTSPRVERPADVMRLDSLALHINISDATSDAQRGRFHSFENRNIKTFQKAFQGTCW